MAYGMRADFKACACKLSDLVSSCESRILIRFPRDNKKDCLGVMLPQHGESIGIMIQMPIIKAQNYCPFWQGLSALDDGFEVSEGQRGNSMLLKEVKEFIKLLRSIRQPIAELISRRCGNILDIMKHKNREREALLLLLLSPVLLRGEVLELLPPNHSRQGSNLGCF